METQSFSKNVDWDEEYDKAVKRLKKLNPEIFKIQKQFIKARKSNDDVLKNNASENLNNLLEKRKELQIEIEQIKSARESRDLSFKKVNDWLNVLAPPKMEVIRIQAVEEAKAKAKTEAYTQRSQETVYLRRSNTFEYLCIFIL
jgi:hypothetical protein